MRYLSTLIAVVALILLFGGYVSAVPLIIKSPNNVSDGDIVTINGGGFGSKNISEPLIWDDFEIGTIGDVIAGDNEYQNSYCSDCWSDKVALISAGTEPPMFSNQNNRVGSNLAARFHFIVGSRVGYNYSDSWLVYEGSKELTDKVFLSFWIWWDWGITNDPVYQMKFFRMTHSDGLDSRPQIYLNCLNGTTVQNNSYNTTIWPADVYQINPRELKIVGKQYCPMAEKAWSRVEMIVKGSATETGEVHIRFVDPVGNRITQRDYIGVTLPYSYWQDFMFGLVYTNVDDPHTAETTLYYDDIYIDDSWARIEIGNKETYEACTHLEMQIPIKWNNNIKRKGRDDQIKFKVNRGAFNVNDPAFLFVIDNDGGVSKGVSVTFTE